jgi:flagellar hook-associated protein 3 FlgL
MALRIPDKIQREAVVSQLSRAKKKLYNAQMEVSTGRKGDKYMSLNKDAGPEIREEAMLMRVQMYAQNNAYVDQRISRYESAVKNILGIAGIARRELVSARNGNPESINNAPVLFGEMLNQLVGILNYQDLDGRYIFSGSRTNIPPVDPVSMIVTPPTGGGPDTSYYQGDSTILSVPISQEHTISYGMLANEAGFEKMMRAIRLAKTTSYTVPMDQTRIQNSLDTIDQAIEDLGDMLAEIGMYRRSIEDTNLSHSQFEQYLEEVIGKRLNVDFPSAVTRVSYYTDQVSASYYLIQRINSLSLINYLK